MSVNSPFNQHGAPELIQHGDPTVNHLSGEAEVNHESPQHFSVKDVETLGDVKHQPCQRMTGRNFTRDQVAEKSPDGTSAQTQGNQGLGDGTGVTQKLCSTHPAPNPV